jgi:hypothetical protein
MIGCSTTVENTRARERRKKTGKSRDDDEVMQTDVLVPHAVVAREEVRVVIDVLTHRRVIYQLS